MCILLSLAIMISTMSIASAVSLKSQPNNTTGIKISWDELPDTFKSVINKNAEITYMPDGTYNIVQETGKIAEKFMPQKTYVPFGFERYAPDGGKYTNLSNSTLMGSPLRILQIAYIPEDPVSNWLCNNTPNLITIIKDWVAAFGISRTIYLIYANYGITID